MQLTDNFAMSEFDCHDGTSVSWDLVDNVQKLANNLQVLRDTIGKAVHVISAFRPSTYNKKVGGAKRSYHIKAMAADIRVNGMNPKEVKAVIEVLIAEGKMEQGGVGLYKTFVHYDIRGRKARWSG
tara:strand:+ start:4845 stop:5222 length:378 start_codon:yes stop_codon:yes gene_type:complete